MKKDRIGNQGSELSGNLERSRGIKRFSGLGVLMILLAFSAIAEADVRSNPAMLQSSGNRGAEGRYVIEISVSRRILTLYGIEGEKRNPLREYRVGSAVLGIDVYPLGRGQVTAIEFNPWWHPTPYSREVFRKRGINLPAAVPPGHPLNYMGPVKISLSHRTWKGAIYRIHGNNNPGRVGRRVTGGCFVMYNNDVLELARTISVGTEVNILP